MSATEHRLAVRRSARVYIAGESAGEPVETWLACHGYGQLAARFIRRLEPLAGRGRVIIAPEALNRFYLDGGTGPHGPESRVGATWMTREDRLAEIDDYVDYLETALDRFAPEPASLVGFGFSQGVATICRWAARTRRSLRALILWSGLLPPELEPGPDLFAGARLVLAYGASDPAVPPGRIAAESDRLRAGGLEHRLVEYEGGHAMDAEVLRRIAADL